MSITYCNVFRFNLYCKEDLNVMIIEVDCCLKGNEKVGPTKSFLIPAGGCLGIEIEGGRVVIANSLSRDQGLVFGRSKNVETSVYRDGKDELGEKVNSDSILLTGKQIILVSEPRKEVRIYSATF